MTGCMCTINLPVLSESASGKFLRMNLKLSNGFSIKLSSQTVLYLGGGGGGGG